MIELKLAEGGVVWLNVLHIEEVRTGPAEGTVRITTTTGKTHVATAELERATHIVTEMLRHIHRH